MLNRGSEEIKWKMEMIYAAEDKKKKKKHESALHSDELTTIMHYAYYGGVAVCIWRLINMMGDK